MVTPLLLMVLAFTFYLVALVLMRTRNEVLLRESRKRWVQDMVAS
jgi:heme exporter protein C